MNISKRIAAEIRAAADAGLSKLPEATEKPLADAVERARVFADVNMTRDEAKAANEVLDALESAAPDLIEAGRDEIRAHLTHATEAVTDQELDRLRSMGYDERRRAMLAIGAEIVDDIDARAARAQKVGDVLLTLGKSALAVAPKVLPWLLALI